MFGEKLQIFNNFKHLGHSLSTNRNILRIDNIINDMKTETNVLFNNFYNLYLYFNNHCLSLYDSELYDINDASIKILYTFIMESLMSQN